MQVSVEKTGDLARKVTVVVPADKVSEKIESRLNEISKSVKLDGFRPGKVPSHVIRKRFGEQVQAEAQRDLVADTMADALDGEKLSPVGQPNVDFGDMSEGKDYTYTISLEIMPEIKLGSLDKIKLTRYTAKADKGQVDTVLEGLQKSHRKFNDKDGKAAKGDMVILDAKGFDKKSGEALEGAEVNNHPLEIGSGAFIPGFEEKVEGHKAGEKFSIEVTFPKQYHASELAGKPARFDVEIHKVKEAELPKLDDEFAQKFGVKTIDELKKNVLEQVEGDIKRASEQRVKRELFDELEKDNKFDLPQTLIDNEFNAIWRSLTADMQRSGATFEALGKSEDEMRAEHRKLAERRVRLGLVLAEIGKEQNIEVDAKDVSAEIDRVVSNFPAEQAEKARNYFNSRQGRQEIVGPLFENKVVEWVLSQCKVSEKEMKADELLKEITG